MFVFLRYKVDQGEIPTPQIRGENCLDFRGKMGKMTRFPLILLDAPNASTKVLKALRKTETSCRSRNHMSFHGSLSD